MTWPAIVAWILIFIGIWPRRPYFLLYLFIGFGAFGSLTLFPGEKSGVNLLPQACCAVFLVCKILMSKGQLSRALDVAIDPAGLGLLFAFLAYGLFSAYVMPRFFARMVEVIPMNTEVPWAVLLSPTSGNITQPAYLMLSAGVALVFALSGGNATFRRHYMQALLVGGLVLIATGLADMIFTAAGLDSLLEPFRNASYSLLVDVEVLGSKRVVGFMPEASAFGPACVVAAAGLTFLRPCFENSFLRKTLVPLTIAGLLVMAALSTSSTSYVGLAVFALVFAANWLRRAMSPNALDRDGLKWEAILAMAAAIALLGIITIVPHMLDSAYDMVDTLVFKKSESESYVERTMWTRVGMAAFFATDGLGVGLGSARTSNWFASVLSNTGIIGGLLIGSFVLRIYFLRCRGADFRKIEFVTGLKYSLLLWFASAALSCATVDFGVAAAAAMGLISSLTTKDWTASVRSGITDTRQIRARGSARSA